MYEVTTLNDSGTGSLRACVEASGPRTCVFRVGGTIVTNGLDIVNPYITIAGQTAPGDGIMLRNANGVNGAVFTILTNNVIIRHLRARPGPSAQNACCIDAMQILRNSHDIMIDHLSMSWAVDENFSISSYNGSDPKDITVQWSIMSEGLDHSTHQKSGGHSKGALISSYEYGQGNNVTIHHNLFAHNRDRNPDLSNAGIHDVVNNVIYNPKSEFGEYWNHLRSTYINHVGNYAKRGPDTTSKAYGVDLKPNGGDLLQMYVHDNITPQRKNNSDPQNLVVQSEDYGLLVSTPFTAPPVQTTSPQQAYTDVLADVGATLPKRDSVDTRVVNEVKNGTGRVPDHPDDVGGYPTMQGGTAPTDSDHDGMPDAWEQKFGLNPNDASDRNGDFNNNGYTNLEDYLNELAGDINLGSGSSSSSGGSSSSGNSSGGSTSSSGGSTSSGSSSGGFTAHVCNQITAPNQTPAGFGNPFDLALNTSNLLVSVLCNDTTFTLTLGDGNQARYVYEKAYLWGGTSWQQVALNGASQGWIIGKAEQTIPYPSGKANDANFIVGYICSWTGSAWKCGCKDSACTSPQWQLQGFSR